MKLTVKEMVYLSERFADATPISLFSNLSAPLEGNEGMSLQAKGVLTASGDLAEGAQELLQAAAGAKRSARLVLKDSFAILEKYTYYVEGGKLLLAENDAGDLEFSLQEDVVSVLGELSQLLGASVVKTTGLQVMLSPQAMLILLVVMDQYRFSGLKAYLDPGVTIGGPVTTEGLMQSLQGLAEGSAHNASERNSLAGMLLKQYRVASPDQSELAASLEALVQKGCLEKLEGGYVLTPDYGTFALNFLIPDTLALIESFNVDHKNQVIGASGLLIAAGLKDLAYFLFPEEGIELSAVSGAQALKIIEGHLNCPLIL